MSSCSLTLSLVRPPPRPRVRPARLPTSARRELRQEFIAPQNEVKCVIKNTDWPATLQRTSVLRREALASRRSSDTYPPYSGVTSDTCSVTPAPRPTDTVPYDANVYVRTHIRTRAFSCTTDRVYCKTVPHPTRKRRCERRPTYRIHTDAAPGTKRAHSASCRHKREPSRTGSVLRQGSLLVCC